MLGTNPIRRQSLRPDGQLEIEEVFYTLQGEGPFAGTPAVFVRTSGCWLACWWCDTEFEQNIDSFLSPAEVLMLVEKEAMCPLIVLTGGDPLRQNIIPFCSLAVTNGYHVQIETAGVRWVPGLEHFIHIRPEYPPDVKSPGVSVVCSPKTGKVCDEMSLFACVWKYIISCDDKLDRDDGLPVSSTQIKGELQTLARPGKYSRVPIYVQPCDTNNEDKNRVNRDLAVRIALQHGYRLSLQQHKLLGLR